ncbi:hypothetical protein [Haladaptatus salinisoli]|uniref:hypothetical protein n=1 Tax=Haladaptatus salinisoli TaxID=2884876 RepID=UPI001D0B175C|nr:hypothetical protein [Haladaptatus salinisoli]
MSPSRERSSGHANPKLNRFSEDTIPSAFAAAGPSGVPSVVALSRGNPEPDELVP